MPSPVEIETYMRGECHIHAIAAVRMHGGGFAICYDDAEIYFEDEDTSISSVVHVWSVHDTPNGLVARDVLGDIPFTTDAMRAHLEEFFPDMAAKLAYGDAWIDIQGRLEEIEALSGDDDHQPLFAITEGDIAAAAALPSVNAVPSLARGSDPMLLGEL